MRKQERLPDLIVHSGSQISNVLRGKDYADAEEVLFYCKDLVSQFYVQVTYLDPPPQNSDPLSSDWLVLQRENGSDFILFHDETVLGRAQGLPKEGRAALGIRLLTTGTAPTTDKVVQLSKLVQ